VGVAAIVLALLGRAWALGVYAGTLVVSGLAAVTWVFWVNHWFALSDEEFAFRRLTGTTVLMLAALTPLLLQRAWSPGPASGGPDGSPGPDALIRRSAAAWLIVLVGALSHPGSMLVGYSGSGLPGGWPSFPGTAGCVAEPAGGANVRVVVGYADSYPEAIAMQQQARDAGLPATKAGQDGCGRLRVYVDDVTPTTAQALVAAAHSGGLNPTVELDLDG
jgi:hypothetical protein